VIEDNEVKDCFECGEEVLSDAEFCHKCGRRVKSKSPQSTLPPKAKRGPDEQLIARSKAELDDLRLGIAKSAGQNNKQMWLWVGFFSVITFLVFTSSNNLDWYSVIPGLIVVIALTRMAHKDRWLVMKEYYSIGGSIDQNGEHRCIFCGNRGIFRKGEYASETTYAACSKCKSPLFIE